MTRPPFSDEERRELRRVFGPDAPEPTPAEAEELLSRLPQVPGTEADVERVVQRLAARRNRPPATARAFAKARVGFAAAAVAATLGVLATAFHTHEWDGIHIKRGLSYEEAFGVLANLDRHFETRRSAQAKIYHGVLDAIEELDPFRTDPVIAGTVQSLRDRVRVLLSEPASGAAVRMPDGVLLQLLAVAKDSSRPPRERRQAVQRMEESVAAGMLALWGVRPEGERMRLYSDIMLGRIRDALDAAPKTAPQDPGREDR